MGFLHVIDLAVNLCDCGSNLRTKEDVAGRDMGGLKPSHVTFPSSTPSHNLPVFSPQFFIVVKYT